jgi:hypothetical protein
MKTIIVAACLLLAGCISIPDTPWPHQDGRLDDVRWNRDVSECHAQTSSSYGHQFNATRPQTLFEMCMKGRGYSIK